LVAEVEDGRLVSLKGDPEHPVTRGFICTRTSRFPEMLGRDARLLHPLMRVGGELRPCSMSQALDYAAERLATIRAESGPAAIFHYRSGGSLGLLKSVADRFFEQFGPCTSKIGDICSGAGEAAQEADFGVSDSNDLFDLDRSKNIVIWGKNLFVSNLHLIPRIRKAREEGRQVWLIDPVHHKGGSLADRFLKPRPGGDLDLALGVLRVLLERDALDPKAADFCANLDDCLELVRSRTVEEYASAADLPLAALEDLATAFSDGPTAILVGWGMQRRLQGGSIVRALDALSALSGNLFRPGGGSSFYFGRRAAFDVSAISSGAAARHVREPMFGPDVLSAQDPPIRAIWVTAGNPVCMLPDSKRVAEALERTEFVVVVDPFLTDTGRRADLVLPVPSLVEDDDLLGAYGHHWISESRPIVPPPPGVLHEVELFQELASRLGLSAAMSGSVDEYKQKLLSRAEERGLSLEKLRQGSQRNPFRGDQLFPEGRVDTSDAKVRLISERPAEAKAEESEEGLWFMSLSNITSQASQWSRDPGELLEVTVHPDSAEGLHSGDEVQLENSMGSIRARLVLDPLQRRDVALYPKGGHFDRGQSANALIQARCTDMGMGGALLDCKVRIRKL
jgi:anaerobic selenocysteine-containing dehydrogenase